VTELTRSQVALVAAVGHRERTPSELAASLNEKPSDLERSLVALRKLGLVDARMDRCPLCQHIFGGRLYRATDQGLLLLAESPLMRRAAIA
jgi:DNA-binding transcriptional ArsR family regulator